MINLNRIIDSLQNKKIVLWGDFILDEYILTQTARVSREAPVLVTEYESDELKLGGAGNVVLNLKALGAEPVPVGITGTDEDSDNLIHILNEKSIDTSNIIRIENYTTPKKSRVLSGGDNTKKQQVLRIDKLNKKHIPQTVKEMLLEKLDFSIEQNGYLIVSDYITDTVDPEIFSALRKKRDDIKIITDSRKRLTEFKGTDLATPNEPEIKAIFPGNKFLCDEDYIDAGNKLMERLNSETLIVKRGQKGMIVFEKECEPRIIGIYGTSDIVDVTGAGDTVISVLTLSMACGNSTYESAELATVAAGMAVMKEGAYPISFNELKEAVSAL